MSFNISVFLLEVTLVQDAVWFLVPQWPQDIKMIQKSLMQCGMYLEFGKKTHWYLIFTQADTMSWGMGTGKERDMWICACSYF